MLSRQAANLPVLATPRAGRPLIGVLATALAAALALSALCAAPALAASRGGDRAQALPQAAVLTNLRSVTGRTIYLVLRPAPAEVEGLRERAERVAQAASAKVRLRAAGPLWVAVLEHKERGLDVHRQGRDLRIDEGPLGSLDDALSAGVRLRAGRSDSDLDQEILLQARNVMRDRQDVPQRLVALAQAAAARQVLLRYVSGDDVGAATWGRRYLPLLSQHPDAALLKELVAFAWEALTVPPPPDPPRIAQTGAAPAGWGVALTSAAGSAGAARRFLASPPKEEAAGSADGKPEGKSDEQADGEGKAHGKRSKRKKGGEAKAAAAADKAETGTEEAGEAADKAEAAGKAADKAAAVGEAADKATTAGKAAHKAADKAADAHKAPEKAEE